MNLMDLSEDIRNGTFYNMESVPFTEVRYIQDSDTEATFIFNEDPGELPERVFLMPSGDLYDYTAYLYTLLGEAEENHDDETDETIWTIKGNTKDTPEARSDLRVDLSFNVDVTFNNAPKPIEIMIKNLSTGGFLFISEENFEPGTRMAFIFTLGSTPVYTTAIVRRTLPVRPEHVTGYGCQFVNLTPKAEATIRNFVFRQSMAQGRGF